MAYTICGELMSNCSGVGERSGEARTTTGRTGWNAMLGRAERRDRQKPFLVRVVEVRDEERNGKRGGMVISFETPRDQGPLLVLEPASLTLASS